MDSSLQNNHYHGRHQQRHQLPRQRSTSTRHKRNRSTGSMNSSFSSLFQKTLNPAHHLRKRIVKKAAGVVDKYVTDLINKSPYLLSCDASNNSFDDDDDYHHEEQCPPPIPLLERSEIQVGKLLGEGGFCTVYEIVSIELHGDSPFSLETDEGRLALAREATSSTQATTTLAVKQLRKRLTRNPPQFTLAAADLVVEAQYLSRLCHPHIVPVRGMTKGGVRSMQEHGRFDSYFIVMDKLETTLDQRILKWQRGQEISPSYDQKLTWALQIAQALQYLHQRRILFRDVKPHNIGFRADTGELQLFDFGLCRELPAPRERPIQLEQEEQQKIEDGDLEEGELGQQAEDEEEEEEEDLDDYYLMTKVGTRRYCAVEMYISGRYNEKIDVYSWAMTVYEMISLCKPFANLTDADHQEYVCAQGKRPNPKPFLQQCEQTPRGHRNPLLALVREAWEQYVRYRIDMTTVVEQMEEIIDDRKQQQQELNASSIEKERQVEGSVVSATTATVTTDSDHEDIDSPVHHHHHQQQHSSSRTACSSLSSPPETPRNAMDENDKDQDDKDNVVDNEEGKDNGAKDDAGETKEDAKKDEDITTNENDFSRRREYGQEDAESIHSLIVVDIGVPGSRHSVISAPSLETTSGSEQSARWDDSINTNEVGLMTDASLSTIAFDEYLKPRHRGCAVESPSPKPPSPTTSTSTNTTSAASSAAAVAAAAAAGLAPPALTGFTAAAAATTNTTASNRILPPTHMLSRIVSMEFNDEDEENEEDDEQVDTVGESTKASNRNEHPLLAN